MANQESGKLEFCFRSEDLKQIIEHSSSPAQVLVSLSFTVTKVKDAKGKVLSIPTIAITAKGGGKLKKTSAKKGFRLATDTSNDAPTIDGYPIPPGPPTDN
jgi:hypothetical protein